MGPFFFSFSGVGLLNYLCHHLSAVRGTCEPELVGRAKGKSVQELNSKEGENMCISQVCVDT